VLISLVVLAAQQSPPTLVQKSSGWCSPNIYNVAGNVTVNCIGVDPRALKRLNAELDRKNLQPADKIREADQWTAKYKQVETQLSQAGDDNVFSRQAEDYLHNGELEKAGGILDQILGREDHQTSQTAANHYNRALIFELQFRPLDALPQLKKAYQLSLANESPLDELKYGLEYASVLLDENDFISVEPLLLATLDDARQLSRTNPAAYQPYVAQTLNSLAVLYRDTQRMKEAEIDFQEALDIRRQLAKTNPAAYQPDVAQTLNNLAILHIETGNLAQADEEIDEALTINREHYKASPAVAAGDLAKSLLIASMAREEALAKCKLAREASSVAHDTKLREAANQQLAACPSQ
jgi:hypothetical protein